MTRHGGGEGEMRPDAVKPETWVIGAGRPDPLPGSPLNTPVVAASTYVLGSERIYSRNEGTEGWESFEAMLGGLEGGEAVAFSSCDRSRLVAEGLRAGSAVAGAAVEPADPPPQPPRCL